MSGRCSRKGPSRSLRAVGLLLVGAAVSSAACSNDSTPQTAPPDRVDAVEQLATSEAPAPVVAPRVYAPSKTDCAVVPVFVGGAQVGAVCSEDAASEGLTVLDLSDTWTPRVFALDPVTKRGPQYREKYLELASQPNVDLGLHGIAPNLSNVVARVADDKRETCDAAVDLAPIAEVDAERSSASDAKATAAALKKASSKKVLASIQAELVCAGLLKKAAANGALTGSTQQALEAFRRRHMIVGTGLDADTVRALALGGDELAFRAALRVLRDRVADGAALLEDGSASGDRALVVNRELDLTSFAPLSDEKIPGGAPDLVSAATDAAARELGWTSPAALAQFANARGKDGFKTLRVAVPLPAAPRYHAAHMELRVEIDRGDIFYETPGAAAAKKQKHESLRPPTFVIYAKDGDREVALMRWATTIGGWKKERSEEGEIGLKYKGSDVGDRVWRQIIAAPAWLPPDSTPETDLVRENEDGSLALKSDVIQPGYRNAYGLVMLIHHEGVEKDGKTEWRDHGIRTHGSVDYRSIKKGTSHGCHRLYNQLALRLSGFLLQHRTSTRRGKMEVGYERTIEWNEQSVQLSVPNRGYLYEMDPPVPVRVLEGRVLGDTQKPMSSVIALPDQQKPKEG